MPPNPSPWFDARRREITWRTLLAVAGGYGLSALLAAALSVALPLVRSEAVLTATMLSFLAYCALVIWAYAAASVRRLALTWAGCGLLLAGVLLAGARA